MPEVKAVVKEVLQLKTMAEPHTHFKTINKEIPRLESMLKATGMAIYTDDIALPGMAFAALVRSPHSRARDKH